MSGLVDRLAAIATAAYDRTRDRAGSPVPIVFEAVLAPQGVGIRGRARIGSQPVEHTHLIAYPDLDLAQFDVAAGGFDIVEAAIDALARQATSA